MGNTKSSPWGEEEAVLWQWLIQVNPNPSIPVTPPKQVWYVTGPAFQQLYSYLSNLWAIYHGFTHTCDSP
jgi:hypothetical protein